MEHSGFPSDETLAAFIDGTLDPDERQRVLDHLVTCDECRNNVLAAADPMAEREMDDELTADWIPGAWVPDAESRSADVASDAISRLPEGEGAPGGKPPGDDQEAGSGRRTPSGRWEVLTNPDPPPRPSSGPQLAVRRPSGQYVPIDPRRKRGRAGKRTLKIAGSALAAAAALTAIFLLPPVHRWVEGRRSGMGPLVEAAGRLQYRTVEPRLSGGFAYKRPQPVMRGEDQAKKDPQAWGLFSAAERIQARAASAPTVQNLHALGVANLVIGNYDSAVLTLESAIRKETGKDDSDSAVAVSTDPALLSDLAAAYYAQAKYSHALRGFDPARTAADRAWRLRKSPETAWNRAVTVDTLHEPARSTAAWEQYLQLDPASPWATEAREHLEDLSRPTTSQRWSSEKDALATADGAQVRSLLLRFPKEVRELGEQDLMNAWSASLLAGDEPGATAALLRMRLIAAALEQTSGERLLGDAVRAIDRAAMTGNSRRLAEGHRLYASGLDAYTNRQDGPGTRAALARALPLLREAGSPYALRAELYIASSHYYDNDYPAMQQATEQLPAIPPHYYALAGTVAWVRGMSRLSAGYPDDAVVEYQRALSAFTTLGEVGQQTSAHTLLAEAYEYLDDQDRAWNERYAALDAMAGVGEAKGLITVLHAFARTAAAAGRPEFAKTLLDRAEEQAVRIPDITFRVETLVWEAQLAHQLGRPGASRYIAQARRLLPKVAAGELERETASVTLAEALVGPVEQQSIAKLRQVMDFNEKSGNELDTARLLLVSGRMARAAGNVAAASEYFATAVRVIERQRGKTDAAAFSALNRRYLDEASGELLEVSAARKDYDTIFEVSERLSRTAPSNEALTAAAARSLVLPPTWTFVKFVSLRHRLLIWTAGEKGLAFHSVPISRTRLRQLVADWEASLDDEGGGKSCNDALWQVLVAPMGQALNGRSTVVLIRDAVTANVPLAALVDPASGRFLFEKVRLSNAPTMHDAVAAVRASSGPGPMLVVGAPAASVIDADHARPELGRVAGEAESVASLYGASTTILRGPRKAQLVSELLTARGVHFGGHGTENRANPLLSGIVLSGADGRSEVLYAHEIARMLLRGRPVVVLASCRGSSHTFTRGLRSSSISDAFLTAGASAVIGSITPVDDRLASGFSVDIHRSLAAGMTASAALRAFQRRCLTEVDPAVRSPLFWASFQVAGNPDARLAPTL